MSKIVEIKSNVDPSALVIEYELGNICNYKCSYCFPGSHEGDNPWPDFELAKNNLEHLIHYYKKNLKKSKIILSLIGGEVTLWKNLGKFVTYFKEKHDCIITILSNGSRTLRWWEEYGKMFSRVAISFHHAEASVDHIISVADMLYEKKIIVEVNVSMDPYHWNKCISIANDLKKSKYRWGIILQEIRIDNKIIYDEKQIEFLKVKWYRFPNLYYAIRNSKLQYKKHWGIYSNGEVKKKKPNEFLLDGERHFFGWDCDLGLEELYIKSNGDITGSCGNKLYGSSKVYNLYEENFKELFTPILKSTTCHTLICGCDREIAIQKRNIKKDENLF